MKRLSWLLAAGLLLAVAVPAFAGQGEKCTQDAQTCLNHWSAFKSKGWSGVQTEMKGEAFFVKNVVSNSPAAGVGILPGDQLVALNGAPLSDKEALTKAKGEWAVDQEVTYTVKRKTEEVQLTLKLAAMPEEVFARMVGEHMISDHMGVAQTADAAPEAQKASAEAAKPAEPAKTTDAAPAAAEKTNTK